jgi:hypothetical protein
MRHPLVAIDKRMVLHQRIRQGSGFVEKRGLTLSPLKRGRFYHSSTGTDDLKRVGFTQVSRCF